MQKFDSGEILIADGSVDNHLYILISGRVGVYKGNRMIAETAQSGSIIGEMSVILNRPRTATIKAIEPTTVIDIEGNIDNLIVNHPDVAKKIIINLAERLAKTTTDLYSVTHFIDANIPISK